MGGGLKIEAMAVNRDDAVSFFGHLRTLAHDLNVYRGKVLSFNFTEWGSFGLEFHRLPRLTREDLILPESDLDAIERHTLGIAAHAERLRDAGRHLKRGLLLFGPPGTGKTFSVMYLCGQMPGRTTILLSGQAAPTLGQAAAIARSLQPAMLVLEDVDLVAMERTFGHGLEPASVSASQRDGWTRRGRRRDLRPHHEPRRSVGAGARSGPVVSTRPSRSACLTRSVVADFSSGTSAACRPNWTTSTTSSSVRRV